MIGSLVCDCGRPRSSCQDKLQRRSRTLEKVSVEHLDLKEKKDKRSLRASPGTDQPQVRSFLASIAGK
jgi:hypothetical protein